MKYHRGRRALWSIPSSDYPCGLVDFQVQINKAARPRRMNVDEALAEIFADRDSDLSDESDQESQDVTEHSENSSESDVRKRTKV